jgi:hypothetical protein
LGTSKSCSLNHSQNGGSSTQKLIGNQSGEILRKLAHHVKQLQKPTAAKT